MNQFERHIKERADELRLTELEKRTMRSAIAAHMHAHPAGAVKSPWQSWMFVRIASPVVGAMLLCAGTAYAAQGSLPGDLLYPVKTHVNEPVEVALATSATAKANTEARIAETRVAEAQALAARGELTATTTAELQDSFNAYAASALADAGQTQPATTTTTTTVVTTTTVLATAPAHRPAAMAIIRAATTTSVATTTGGNDNNKEGFASQLKVSLDAQAGILNGLQVQMGLHGEDQHGDNEATSTLRQLQPRTYQHHQEGQR